MGGGRERERGGVHTFPKDISSKANIIVGLELKDSYYNIGVQNVSHCARIVEQKLRRVGW